MSSTLSSLHKILKDETRRKIVIIINEKGSITYTELPKSSWRPTGKKRSGAYLLTEKGKVAFILISEVQEKKGAAERPVWRRRFWISMAIAQIAYFGIALTFYFLHYIDLFRFASATTGFIIGVISIYFIWRMVRNGMPSPGTSQMNQRIKVGYISGGMAFGLLLAFVGGGFLLHTISDIEGVRFTGNNPLYQLFWSVPYLVFSLLVAPAFGGVVFYYLGKRSGFEQPRWAAWVESHIG